MSEQPPFSLNRENRAEAPPRTEWPLRSSDSCASVLQVPPAGLFQTLTKRNLRPPAERRQPMTVEPFARCAVRFRCIEDQPAIEADCRNDRLGEFTNGQLLAGPNVERHRPGIVFHQEDEGVGKIVDMKELAPRVACPPYF